jgi:2-polyprenyl-3-methyl-5-hydroxy-6-metoxy-1,4-benzoquinol methylase
MASQPRCWCGSADLKPFSPDYLVCGECRTLVVAAMPGREIARVEDEERDFYGRRYWFEYQERELGNPDITVRARSDLPERCVYWLRTVLRYRLPPARTLDVGCGHGAFVMLLSRAGYEAEGLELSPWVVDFARRTFGVPVLLGPLEAQSLSPGSLDVITMMDVLEHLAEPMTTLRAAVSALGEDGILVIQTPVAPADLSWEEMVTANHPFLPLMKERGHLYLFNETSLRRLLVDHLGIRHISFEPAYFGAYDMFVIASRRPLASGASAAVAKALSVSPDSRVVQALLDLDDRRRGLQDRYAEAEGDRIARLAALHEQGARLMVAEGERNVVRAELTNLKRHLTAVEAARDGYMKAVSERDAQLVASEADRAARLAVIHEQAEQIAAIEADRAARLIVIHEQAERIAAIEADRAARLAIIHEQAERIAAIEADQATRLTIIDEQAARLAASEAERAAFQVTIRAQVERLQADASALEALRAELAVLRFRSLRVMVAKAVRLVRAHALWRFIRRRATTPPTGAAVTSALPATTSRPAALPRAAAIVYENLEDYVRTIDAFAATRLDLVPVRASNHSMIDVLASAVPLTGRRLLDVGGSPHGFALEHALVKGVAAYTGVGLGVWEPVEIHHQQAVGRLWAADGEALPLESESVDIAMSLSTFEHFPDGAAVLREIHRVLCPGGTLFVSFQPVWTSSTGHHLHHLPSVARVIPPWAHLLWTPTTMRQVLASRWPADARMSLDEAVAWIYESSEINRVDVVTLRRMFEVGPFTIDWITPLREEDDSDQSRLAAYLATLLPYSAEDLLTLGFSILMRKT